MVNLVELLYFLNIPIMLVYWAGVLVFDFLFIQFFIRRWPHGLLSYKFSEIHAVIGIFFPVIILINLPESSMSIFEIVLFFAGAIYSYFLRIRRAG